MKKITRTSILSLTVCGVLIVLGSQTLGVSNTNNSSAKEVSKEPSAQPEAEKFRNRKIAEAISEEIKELKAQLDAGSINEEEYQYRVELLPVAQEAKSREYKLREFYQLFEEEGRRLRFAVIDIQDEIYGFIKAKNLLSAGGPKDQPGWYVLEKLSMDRLQVRIKIKMIEQKGLYKTNSKDHSEVLKAKLLNDELVELENELSAMDAEHTELRTKMTHTFANTSVLQFLLNNQMQLQQQEQSNRQAMVKLRLLMMTKFQDETLLHWLIGE